MIPSSAKQHLSRKTNGRKLLDEADGRSVRARRYRDLVRMFTARIGHVDDVAKTLVDRAAGLAVVLETMEACQLASKSIKADSYTKLVGQYVRVLRVLGLTKVGELPDDANALMAYVARQYGMEAEFAGPDQQRIRAEALIGDELDDDDDDDDDDYKPRRVVTAKKVKRRASRYRADDDEED